jgi:hypothetical protein
MSPNEGDLDPRAPPQYWCLGAKRPQVRRNSRSRSQHPGGDLRPASAAPLENRFARWKPLRKFAAALDRPVGGTPVETIVSVDRDH